MNNLLDNGGSEECVGSTCFDHPSQDLPILHACLVKFQKKCREKSNNICFTQQMVCYNRIEIERK